MLRTALFVLALGAPSLAAARSAVAALLARRLGYEGVRCLPAGTVRRLASGIESSPAVHLGAHHAA